MRRLLSVEQTLRRENSKLNDSEREMRGKRGEERQKEREREIEVNKYSDID